MSVYVLMAINVDNDEWCVGVADSEETADIQGRIIKEYDESIVSIYWQREEVLEKQDL